MHCQTKGIFVCLWFFCPKLLDSPARTIMLRRHLLLLCSNLFARCCLRFLFGIRTLLVIPFWSLGYYLLRQSRRKTQIRNKTPGSRFSDSLIFLELSHCEKIEEIEKRTIFLFWEATMMNGLTVKPIALRLQIICPFGIVGLIHFGILHLFHHGSLFIRYPVYNHMKLTFVSTRISVLIFLHFTFFPGHV